jgi:hypothetical protein
LATAAVPSTLTTVTLAAGATKTSRPWSSADLNAAIERVAPDVLALLADGVPRPEAAIVRALAGRQPKGEVALTLMRLAVLGQVEGRASKCILAPRPRDGAGLSCGSPGRHLSGPPLRHRSALWGSIRALP